jgi:hypothetical protein
MPVNEEEKRRIIDLHFNQGKTIREVSRSMGKSSHDITPVTKEHRMRLAQNYALVHGEQNDDTHSVQDKAIPNVKAYKLFDEGKNPLEVATQLNLPGLQVQQFYNERFAGSVVLVAFFIPVYFLILLPEINRTLAIVVPTTNGEDEYGTTTLPQYSFPLVLVSYVIMHLVFGITVGLTSSTLSIKFGSRYRCSKCDISFSRIDSYQKHLELIHGEKPIQLTRILILGGGFAGIEVLRELQKAFQNDIAIDITLVSRDNFFLFTPMLPEISSGMIETRHIVTPLRVFCNRAKFYEADVESIDIDNKQVVISHRIGKQTNPIEWRSHILKYDYLVIALGSETNFFGMDEAAKQAFTLKSLGDAIVLRNHVINMLEQADIEHEDLGLRKSLLTFVVVGGGFSGVEIVGELNDFVLDSIKYFYHNLQRAYTRIVLVNSGRRILPEVPGN